MTMQEGSSLYDATRDMLIRERETILTRMKSITQDALNLEFEQDGVPPSGYERESALTLMLDSRLADIDSALARITDGTYGECADCSKPIPPKRLQVLPFATLCVACQSLVDKKVRRR